MSQQINDFFLKMHTIRNGKSCLVCLVSQNKRLHDALDNLVWFEYSISNELNMLGTYNYLTKHLFHICPKELTGVTVSYQNVSNFQTEAYLKQIFLNIYF